MVLQRSNARIISPERKKLLMQAVKVSAENGRARALQATKK